jgi:hypothetical protein
MKTIILEAGIVFNRLQTWWMSFLTKVGLNKSGIVSQDPLTNAIQRMRYTISSLHVTNQTSKSVYEIMNSELARFGTVTKYVNGVGQKLLYSGKYSSDLKMYNSFFSSTDNISAHLLSSPVINYCRA